MDVNISNALSKINELINGFITMLPNIILGLIVFAIFFVAAGWLRQLVQNLTERSGLATNASLLMGRLTRWTVIFFGILVGLSIVIPSFEPGQLISLLGIGSIAVGFAFKDIAQNFLAGILILLTQPFRVGDQIIKGDYEGTIEEIQTRATVIKTYDGRRIVIPNADLFTDSVTVNTAFDKRRSQYDVGIGYEADIEQAREIMLDVLDNTEGVLKEPAPDVLTVALDSSSVNLRPRWWTSPQRSEVVAVENRVITSIKYALDEAGINIPFPIRTVYFHDESRRNKKSGEPASNSVNADTPSARHAAA